MVSFKTTVAGLALLFGTQVHALSIPVSSVAELSNGFSPNYENHLFSRADPKDFYLRIMPLGASITAGSNSPPEDTGKNGYRKYIRDKLRFEGWKVNMVGNFNSGTMKDNVSIHTIFPL